MFDGCCGRSELFRFPFFLSFLFGWFVSRAQIIEMHSTFKWMHIELRNFLLGFSSSSSFARIAQRIEIKRERERSGREISCIYAFQNEMSVCLFLKFYAAIYLFGREKKINNNSVSMAWHVITPGFDWKIAHGFICCFYAMLSPIRCTFVCTLWCGSMKQKFNWNTHTHTHTKMKQK